MSTPNKRVLLGIVAIIAGTMLLGVPLWLSATGVASPQRMVVQVFLGVFLLAKGISWASSTRRPKT